MNDDALGSVIDPADLPIVTAFDARRRALQDAQEAREDAAYLAFMHARALEVHRRDRAALTAAGAWAREPRTLVANHGTLDLPETPEAFNLRAHVLRNAEVIAALT